MAPPKLPRDRFDYSPIVRRTPWKLPKGARVAVWTVVNIEEWDIEKPVARQYLTAPQGVATVPDVPNWAWHEYGMRVGFWRLFESLAKRKLRATTSINANVCHSYPAVAEAMRDGKWEFMAHAVKQGAMHLQPDQRAVIRESIEVIQRFTGKKPKGWLGPGLTETFDTPELLVAAGIKYIGDWVYDDEPTTIRTANGPLVTLPYSVELNDIPMMIVQHHEGEHLLKRAIDQFDRLYLEGRHRAKIMALAIHPYISGQPHRIKYLEAIYEYAARFEGVLHWNGLEILEWYQSTQR